jgi:hypothetical protein
VTSGDGTTADRRDGRVPLPVKPGVTSGDGTSSPYLYSQV